MTNRFPFSDNEKRYHTAEYHYRKTFGKKVFRALIDGGFGCPNRDGVCGWGGCSFCADGSSAFAPNAVLSVGEQLHVEEARLRKKYFDFSMLAYFSVRSGTYAPVSVLKEKYMSALRHPGVCGLVVGTRADCINEENVALLRKISEKGYLSIELGLQSIHDTTAKKINRGYDYNKFLRAYTLLKENGIRVCVHIINGLVGETREMMVQTAKTVGKLQPDGVKIHLMHVLQGTKDALRYARGELSVLSKDDYVDIVCRQLEYLSPNCVIERITGDGEKSKLLAPLWSCDKISVLGSIDYELARRGIIQGDFFAE